MRITGATDGVADAVVPAEVAGAAGCWAAWQPHATAPSTITLVSRAVTAEIVEPWNATASLS